MPYNYGRNPMVLRKKSKNHQGHDGDLSPKQTGSEPEKDKLSPEGVSLRISLKYMLAGGLWILLSDKVLALLVSNKDAMTYISMIKGWVYVAVTGLLVYLLVYSAFRRIKTAENNLYISYQDLSEANEELEAAYEQVAVSQNELQLQYEKLVENQKRLEESEELYRLISEAANDAIWEVKDGERVFSDRWFEITGYSREELGSMGDWKSLIHPEDRPHVGTMLEEYKKGNTPYYKCEYRLRTKGNGYKWLQDRGKALFDERGSIRHMGGSHTDITELKEYEKELCYLAYYDQLTGARNRSSLINRIKKLTGTNNNKKMALFIADIDNFKYINDTLGHSFGDRLLVGVCRRLESLVEASCTIYRLSGDEFVILLEDFDETRTAERLAVKLLKGFEGRFEINGSSMYITVSMGVSLYPEHGKDMDELLKNADIALYKAKETGRNRTVFYNAPMNEAVSERVFLEKHLRTALDNNEFELYYQPQVDIATGKVSGFEALIRWNSPEMGLVSPLKFIGIAEDTHMIIPIGEWVLKNACIFLKKLHQQGYDDLSVSVNISMLQLLQEDFVEKVTEILDWSKINPRHLELEITESILMESYEAIAGKLKLLKGRGIKIALDDFGKGYSSLNYLKQLPISTLKIDKSFIDTIGSEGRNKSLTDLIVKIGRAMGLCVVAEGVETREQLDYLLKHKCTRMQGYLFSKPVTEETVTRTLEAKGWII